MRLENWPARLMDTISAASERRFSGGENDCFTFCLEVIEAITGENVAKDRCPCSYYKTAKAAIKQIKRQGFSSIEDMWNSVATPIEVAFAQRGDLVLIEVGQQLPATGVVVDNRAVFLAPEGITYREVADAQKAWRID